MSSDIAAEVGPAIQGYQAAVEAYDREMARILGVGTSDLACLEIVVGATEKADGVTPRDLADQLGFTTGSVTTMIDRLEKRGYVSRHAHPDDRRKILVRATPELVERVMTVMGPLLVEGTARLLPQFTAAELATVTRFMLAATVHQVEHTVRLRAVPPMPPLE